jgi:hypothetical protein
MQNNLIETIDAIARELGNDWQTTHESNAWWQNGIVHKGTGLILSYRMDQGKIVFAAGGWPQASPSAGWRGDLTVTPESIREDVSSVRISADKPVERIAKELKTRLAENALRVWHACKAEADKHTALHEKAASLYGKLADTLGPVGRKPSDGARAGHDIKMWLQHPDVYGDVTVAYHGENVNLLLRAVPPHIAERICQILADTANTGKAAVKIDG